MKSSAANHPPAPEPQSNRPAGLRLWVLAPVLLLLGAALAGLWFKYGKPAAGSHPAEIQLSRNTVELLQHLNSPVEIRFYSVLPPGSVPGSLQDFSRRVDQLLSAFQTANDRQVHVTRNLSASAADAAAADGLRPFNLEKGDACFLGINVISGSQNESLPQLQPEWEPALEFDLARAILRVTATPATVFVKPSAPVSPEVTNEIARLIPNINGMSLDGGIGILRTAAVSQMTEAGAEMEKQIQAAQQQVADAQNGRPVSELQAAVKHLQQVQLEQAEKIKAIAARLQTEISVFEQMKAAPAPK